MHIYELVKSPYDMLAEKESEQYIYQYMALYCLLKGKLLKPTNIIVQSSLEYDFEQLLGEVIDKTSIEDIIKVVLDLETLKNDKKKKLLIEILKNFR